jgi:hypothetical protein
MINENHVSEFPIIVNNRINTVDRENLKFAKISTKGNALLKQVINFVERKKNISSSF